MGRRCLKLNPAFTGPWLTSRIPERGWSAGTRMGSVVRAFSRRNLIAIAAGVMLAGAPLVAFDFWLDRLIDTQGGEQVSAAARRAVSLAEARLNQTIGALNELAAE